MTTSFARFLSILLHPLLMPTLLFGLLLFQAPGVVGMDAFSPALRLSLLVLIFIGTFAVPSLLIVYLVRTGYVSSLQLETLADRRLPYFLTALIYTFVAYLFAFRMQLVSTVAPEIAILLGSIAVSILLVGLISLYWQISAHGVGLGGVLGGIGGLMLKFSLTDLFLPMLLLVLLAGFVASARLKLNAHTPGQILAGLALGVTISLLAVFWFI
ncbi:membrane-associated phospholipid phosphatase [Spirosoma lacussanchae]|uniref:hypothetical protein n=1 Tax=Spirosoma lacussanchae TaxID=1884249 RepID=UPI002939134C|nr:hypothetical protein [Spirosoma lacussanchae]